MKQLSSDSSRKNLSEQVEQINNTKYALLTTGASYFESITKHSLERGGLYAWQKAFPNTTIILASEMRGREDRVNDYDIVHINMTPGEIGLAREIREYIDKSTKLIVNLDYAVEILEPAFAKMSQKPLESMFEDFIAADLVFAQEPYQYNLLKMIIYDAGASTKVTLLPHPCPVMDLSATPPEGLFIPYEERLEAFALMFHRYDGHFLIPKMIMKDLPENVLKFMFGCTKETMLLKEYRFFDAIVPIIPWGRYIVLEAHMLAGLEYRTHSAGSRFGVENAALGIPTVATNNCYMTGLIWPELVFSPQNIDGMRKKVTQLMTDEKYRLKMASQGYMKVKEFDLIPSAIRMLEELDMI